MSPTLDVDGDELTGVAAATRANGEDLALLGLLLGGVGDDQTAGGRLLGLGRAYDDAVFERLQVHAILRVFCVSRGLSLGVSCPGGFGTPIGRVPTVALSRGEC